MSVRALRRGSMAGRGAAPVTYTIFADASDGYVYASADAAPGSGSAWSAGPQTLPVGVQPGGTDACESFLAFDTSVVVGTISSATLSLWGLSDSSATDFIIEVRVHDWGTSVTNADWVARGNLGSKTLVASMSTAGFVTSAYNALTSEAAFLTNINQSGSTRLLINSDRHRLSLGGANHVGLADRESGNGAKLVIQAL